MTPVDLARQRKAAIDKSASRIREIERDMDVSYQSLGDIRKTLLELMP